MAIQIGNVLNVAKSINKPILDTSYIHGSLKYGVTVADLPTSKEAVKVGNLGIVTGGQIPYTYIAKDKDESSVVWELLRTGGGGGTGTGSGDQLVYFDKADLEGWNQDELANMPDNLLVSVQDEISVTQPYDILTSLFNAISSLQQQVNKLKNTLNDMACGDITDADSNYGTYISQIEGDPRKIIEVDWTDSSNEVNVHKGTTATYGTPEQTADFIDERSWYDTDTSAVIYNNTILKEEEYPYYGLDMDGTDPSTNETDGLKYRLRHFSFKFAKTLQEMVENKTKLIPYEPVLCLENSVLYYYNVSKNKMVPLAGGGGSSTEPDVDPSSGGGDNEQEITMAEIVEALASGNIGEIVLADINMDPSVGGAKKYSVYVANGDLRITEVTGAALTPVNSGEEINSVKGANLSITVNEVYANDTQEYIDNPTHSIAVPVSHNFVELANINPKKTFDLSGLTLQYYNPAEAVSGNPASGWHMLKLRGHINPGSTFLIRGAQVASTVAPSTVINVDTFDMEWYDEDNKLMAFNNAGGTLYLTFDQDLYPNTEYAITKGGNWAKNPAAGIVADSNTSNDVLPGNFMDLFAWGNSDVKEAVAFDAISPNKILVRRNMLDRSSQALPASIDVRTNKNGKYIEGIDVVNNYVGNAPDFRPYASYENKNVYTTRSFFREEKPYCVTVTFGIDPTTTRCFNWISPGSKDEFVFWRKKGTNVWNVKESYKPNDGQDPDLREVTQEFENGDTYKMHIPVYDRIQWETSGGTFVTTHKCIIKNLEPSLKYYTDKDLLTVSSTETEFTKGTEYEYCVGPGVYDAYGVCTGPDTEVCSPIYQFNVRSAVLDKKWSFVQHTDQQGFVWMEYETWRRTANIIRAQFNPQFTINTGDMTQNGNRLSEWIDYSNAADSLTKGLDKTIKLGGTTLANATAYTNASAGVEQMNVVGNNDLAPILDYMLGNGSDALSIDDTEGKASPKQFTYFYTYELDLENFPGTIDYKTSYSTISGHTTEFEKEVKSWIPSCYSFNYNNCHFTAICSEITNTAAVYEYGENRSQMCTEKSKLGVYSDGAYVGEGSYPKTNDLIESWLQNDLNKWYKYAFQPEASAVYPWCICYMHEMPWTILTAEYASVAYTGQGSSPRVNGCKLNDRAAVKFHIAEIFQNNHVRLVIGGHKHTHSNSWPMFENITYTVNGAKKYSWEITPEEWPSRSNREVDSKIPIVVLPNDTPNEILDAFQQAMNAENDTAIGTMFNYPTRYQNNGVPTHANSDTVAWAPVYVMSQASGNKVVSNKEMPTRDIPFLRYYYPATDASKSKDSAVSANQKNPHFIVYEFNPDLDNSTDMNAGNIRVLHWTVDKGSDRGKFCSGPAGSVFFPQKEYSDPLAKKPKLLDTTRTEIATNEGTRINFTRDFTMNFTKIVKNN